MKSIAASVGIAERANEPGLEPDRDRPSAESQLLGWLESFAEEFAGGLSAGVGVYEGVGYEHPGDSMGLALDGPGVLLEMLGPERRLGLVPEGSHPTLFLSARQRAVFVARREETIECRLLAVVDGRVESRPLVLPGESLAERRRLGQLLLMAETCPPDATRQPWEDQTWRWHMATGLLLFLLEAARQVAVATTRRSQRGLALTLDAIQFIEHECRRPLLLEEVARHVDMSPRHFARLLQQWTGTGYTEHLLMARLVRARRLLTGGTRSVLEVAAEVGFGSRDHFIRAFRQFFGWTPLQFRKHWRQASTGEWPWDDVLRVPDAAEVQWLPANHLDRSPVEEAGAFHPLIVANASHSARSLQWIAEDGTSTSMGSVLPGDLVYFHRAMNGSFWRVADAEGRILAGFRTPEARALALIRV